MQHRCLKPMPGAPGAPKADSHSSSILDKLSLTSLAEWELVFSTWHRSTMDFFKCWSRLQGSNCRRTLVLTIEISMILSSQQLINYLEHLRKLTVRLTWFKIFRFNQIFNWWGRSVLKEVRGHLKHLLLLRLPNWKAANCGRASLATRLY